MTSPAPVTAPLIVRRPERPIIFSGPMVRAILDGRKTQTRRPVKFDGFYQHARSSGEAGFSWLEGIGRSVTADRQDVLTLCPYGAPGDRLWVRETWALATDSCTDACAVQYRADSAILAFTVPGVIEHYGERRSLSDGWRPSIHMPRWASRLTLEIAGVRVERVRQIAGGGAVAEGYPHRDPATFGVDQMAYAYEAATEWYHELWDSINAARGYGWDRNPWVWVIEFSMAEA